MARLISHIVLSVLMLISASGLTINFHYCQDQLFDFALIVPADNCRETGAHDNHYDHNGEMDKSNHCDDETIKIESTSDYFVSSLSFDFEKVHLTDLFFTTPLIFEDQSITNSTAVAVLNYKKPPVPQEVVLSQIQSFLI